MPAEQDAIKTGTHSRATTLAAWRGRLGFDGELLGAVVRKLTDVWLAFYMRRVVAEEDRVAVDPRRRARGVAGVAAVRPVIGIVAGSTSVRDQRNRRARAHAR